MVVVAIVVMPGLMMIRNAELIVERPLKDGEKSSSTLFVLTVSCISIFMIKLLFSGTMFHAHG
jgi:hypothetical protein